MSLFIIWVAVAAFSSVVLATLWDEYEMKGEWHLSHSEEKDHLILWFEEGLGYAYALHVNPHFMMGRLLQDKGVPVWLNIIYQIYMNLVFIVMLAFPPLVVFVLLQKRKADKVKEVIGGILDHHSSIVMGQYIVVVSSTTTESMYNHELIHIDQFKTGRWVNMTKFEMEMEAYLEGSKFGRLSAYAASLASLSM